MTVLNVGQGQTYSTIAAAVNASHDGDVVAVQAGTYVNDFFAVNTKITIEGIGGMANLVATQSPPNGKAIVTTNTDVTIDHLAFSGAAVADGNGAGIRYQAGNLTITNSYFHDNQEGLLGNPSADGTITIRNSEFAHNGTGDGYTHNLYVGEIAALSIENSYFHDASMGHEIKSRAHSTTITGTRIYDGDGTGSYSVDLPNGGKAILTDNVIQQGANSQNPAIVHFGGEGSAYSGSSITVAGNLVDNDLGSSSARLLLNQTDVTATVSGNNVQGLTAGQIVSGAANVTGTTFLSDEPNLDTTSPWATTASTVTNLVKAGTAAADYLTGGDGNDKLSGLGGQDVLDGGAGNDRLLGGAGDDRLLGGAGNDRLLGGTGADWLDGGAGKDRLTGGAGADRFVWSNLGDSSPSSSDTVLDFSHAEGDKLDLSAFHVNYTGNTALPGHGEAAVDWHLTSSGHDVKVMVDANGDGATDLAVLIKGVTSLSASDFIL